MMKKRAEAYRREGVWYIDPMSKTKAGFWIGTTPLLKSMDDAGALGSAIRKALAASHVGVPTPDRNADLFQPMLDLSNTKSLREFMKGVDNVGVECDEHHITLTPCRNYGVTGGFVGVPNCAWQLPADVSDKALGEAIMASADVSKKATRSG